MTCVDRWDEGSPGPRRLYSPPLLVRRTGKNEEITAQEAAAAGHIGTHTGKQLSRAPVATLRILREQDNESKLSGKRCSGEIISGK